MVQSNWEPLGRNGQDLRRWRWSQSLLGREWSERSQDLSSQSSNPDTWHIESVLISGIRYKVRFVRTIQSLSREILGLRIGRF
jgi:hypothetical protein